MNEKEAKILVKKFIDYSNYEGYIDFNDYLGNQDIEAIEIILQLLEQKDKRIDELEKALIDEDLKHRNKINKEIGKHIWVVYVANKEIHVFDDYVENIVITKDELLYCPETDFSEIPADEVIGYEDTDKLLKKIVELSKELNKEVE